MFVEIKANGRWEKKSYLSYIYNISGKFKENISVTKEKKLKAFFLRKNTDVFVIQSLYLIKKKNIDSVHVKKIF